MKRILILAAISLFLCSTAAALQDGGGKATKKKSETKKTSGTKSANTTSPRPPASPARPNPSKPEYKATGDEGTVTGVIKFDGTPPAGRNVDMSADPNCATAGDDNMTDDVQVTDGKLANVFVYVKGGKVDDYRYATPSSAVTLDQLGCRYHPRVLGIQVNQIFEVTNSDPTYHNVHPTPKVNTEWNYLQRHGQAAIEKTFTRQEILVPVKCNIHPWMTAHVGVLAHPHFDVSAKDGKYKITGLPPGTYTIVAWHETFGEQTMSVTVGAKELKTQDFTFKQGTAYAPTSLEVQHALILP